MLRDIRPVALVSAPLDMVRSVTEAIWRKGATAVERQTWGEETIHGMHGGQLAPSSAPYETYLPKIGHPFSK